MLGRGWQAGGAALMLLLVVSPAFADDVQSPQTAALLKAGARAAKEKKWEACIDAYAAAIAIEDTPASAGELGLCEEHAGQFADAYRHLQRALEGAPSPPKEEPWSRYQAALARVIKRRRAKMAFGQASRPSSRGRPCAWAAW